MNLFSPSYSSTKNLKSYCSVSVSLNGGFTAGLEAALVSKFVSASFAVTLSLKRTKFSELSLVRISLLLSVKS